MDTRDYIAECHQQLTNTTYYTHLKKDPTPKFAKAVISAIKEARGAGTIDDDLQSALTPNHPRPGRFYILPKIHKKYDNFPPGRPIISGCGTATEKISLYVDLHLKPHVKTLPSYVEDGNDFLRQLISINRQHGPLPSNTIVCTMDVEGLYSNIPTDDFIEASRHYLANDHAPCHVNTLIKFIELTLTQNNFELAGNHYIQIHGTAMGTRMAPSGACLFMGRLEDKLLSSASHKPIIWLRYIDDVFLIWIHGEEELDKFILHSNSIHPSIKFTSERSVTSIPFLDVMVSLHNGFLETDLYSKPTDTHQYLQWSSCHPRHSKTSLPYSLAFRLRRICSTDENLSIRVTQLKQHLTDRGYPPKVIDKQVQKALIISRSEALKPRQKEKTSTRVPFVLTFDPSHTTLANTLHKFLPLLHSSTRCQDAIPEAPMVAFRRPTNIKDMVVRTGITIPSTDSPAKGFNPCNKCAACKHRHGEHTAPIQHTQTSSTFISKVSGEHFNIYHPLNCLSTNVIYLISCKKCGMQYVGETKRSLKIRLLEHCGDAKHNRDKPVARHFTSARHSVDDILIMAIDRPGSSDRFLRLALEAKWIKKLQTSSPHGINVKASR